jgi:hypothetical protein
MAGLVPAIHGLVAGELGLPISRAVIPDKPRERRDPESMP